MKALRLEQIVGSMFNVADEETAVYDANATYNTDDLTYSGGFVYECLQEGTQGKVPHQYPLYWKKIRPGNVEAYYVDNYASTKTKGSSTTEPMIFTFDIYMFEYMVLMGVKASRIEIEIVEDGNDLPVLFEETFYTEAVSDQMDWGLWSFPRNTDPVYVDKIFFQPSEYFYNVDVKVRIYPTSDEKVPEIGLIRLGYPDDLGCTNYGSSRQIKSESKVRRIDGKNTISSRSGYSRLRLPVSILGGDQKVDNVFAKLIKYVDNPALFLGDDTGDFKSLSIYGSFSDLDLSIEYTGKYDLILDSLEETI